MHKRVQSTTRNQLGICLTFTTVFFRLTQVNVRMLVSVTRFGERRFSQRADPKRKSNRARSPPLAPRQ